MSEQVEETSGSAPGNEARIAELQAELNALQGEQEEAIEEAVEEAAEVVDEAIEGAAEEAAEAIEADTGHALSPDEVTILKDIIAERVSAKTETEAVEAVVEETVEQAEVVEDSSPISTHWSERKWWGR